MLGSLYSYTRNYCTKHDRYCTVLYCTILYVWIKYQSTVHLYSISGIVSARGYSGDGGSTGYDMAKALSDERVL